MEQKSGVAVGFAMFAAIMLMINGSFQIIAGLAGIFENEFYVRTPNYFLEFDASAWGWIHLLGGIIIFFAGFAIFRGAVWGRTVGVILAIVSAFAAFAWLPYAPVSAIVIIAIDITVIWALTAHGRDVTA